MAAKRMIVNIPDNIPHIGIVFGKRWGNMQLIANSRGVSIKRCGNNQRELTVEGDPKFFPEVKRKLNRLFEHCGSLSFTQGVTTWMFLYSEGEDVSESQNACFKFQVYDGQLLSHAAKDSSYHLCYTNKDPAAKESSPFYFVSLEAREDECTDNNSSHVMKKTFCGPTEYKEIAEKLRECIQQVQGSHVGKLEARFGSKLWNKLPPEMLDTPMELKELLDFFGSNHDKKYGSFNPSCIESTQIEAIPKELESVFSVQKHRLEMYDIKSSLKGQRVDVRTVFDNGKLTIVRIIKDEKRIANLDFIPIKRQHDYRMSISKQEIVHKLDPCFSTAEMMVEKVNVNAGSDKLILTPCTDEWVIDIIRHKIKDTYILNEQQMVVISNVSEYDIKGWSYNEGEERSLEKSGDKHWELELSNAVWDCAFGKAVGLSPEESLVLHMMPGSADAVSTKVPDCCAPEDLITPEALEEFFETLNWINKQIG